MRKIILLTATACLCLTLSACITRGCDNKPVETCDSQKPPMGWETLAAAVARLIT